MPRSGAVKKRYVVGWHDKEPTLLTIVRQEKDICPCTEPHTNHEAFLNDRGDGTVHYVQHILRTEQLT